METKDGGGLRIKKLKYPLIVFLAVVIFLGLHNLANAETPLHNEPPGTVITFAGKQWIILEQMSDGTTYLILGTIDCSLRYQSIMFDPADTQSIAYYLNTTFYNSLSQQDLIAEHSWSRETVSGTDYGNVTCKIGLISYKEYRYKYSVYYNGSNGVLPVLSGYYWWTLTPPNPNSYTGPWYVKGSGDLNSYYYPSDVSYGVRPTLYLKPGVMIDSNKVVVGLESTPPSSPAGVTAIAESSTSVNISWQANSESDLAGYKIYRNNVEIANVDKTVTTYNDATVAPGITYTYEITAYNTSNRESLKSSPVTVTTPPVMPAGVTGQMAGKNVTLSWQGYGYPCYVIERSNDGINFTQVAEVDQLSFSEILPMWATTYYYRVAQKAQDGQLSAYTEPIQVTTDPVPVPANLSATVSGNSVSLTWSDVGVEGYIVERSLDNTNWQQIATVSTPSYTDSGLRYNTTYFYRIRSDGGNGQISGPSAVVSITTDNISAPSNLTASLDGNNVVLNWQGVSCEIDRYIVERSNDNVNWSNIAEVTETSYTDTNVDLQVSNFYYRVRTAYGDQVSSPSNTVTVTLPPAAPTNLQAAYLGGKNVSLLWQGPSGVSFVIKRSVDNVNWVNVAETSSNSYVDLVPRWQTTYYYRVFSRNAEGMISDPSNTASVVIPAIPAPANLQASVSGNGVSLSWEAVEGISYYRVERSTNNLTWSNIAQVNTTSYTDKNLAWDTNYWYRVKAIDGDQLSSSSNTVGVKTELPPVPLQPNVTYSTGNGKIYLKWNYQKVASGYRVYVNGNMVAELAADKTSFEYQAEPGNKYTVKVEAYNDQGASSTTLVINVSNLSMPGTTTVAKDVLGYAGLAAAPLGGLLALGLALKASGTIISIARMFLGL